MIRTNVFQNLLFNLFSEDDLFLPELNQSNQSYQQTSRILSHSVSFGYVSIFTESESSNLLMHSGKHQ